VEPKQREPWNGSRPACLDWIATTYYCVCVGEVTTIHLHEIKPRDSHNYAPLFLLASVTTRSRGCLGRQNNITLGRLRPSLASLRLYTLLSHASGDMPTYHGPASSKTLGSHIRHAGRGQNAPGISYSPELKSESRGLLAVCCRR
jgi:hypothetical protein